MQDLPTTTIDGEDYEVCPDCLLAKGEEVLLIEDLQNVGFDENPHYEVEGMVCPECKRIYD